MKFKKLTRALCIGALVASVGGAAALSGCTIETNHPRAEITIEFDGTTYELQYTLYRNMYPVTVRHFIELAESGFYDDTIIHDYASNDWYGGGYAYVEESDDGNDVTSYSDAYSGASMDDYLEENDLLSTDFKKKGIDRDNYYDLFKAGAFTASVYTSSSGFDSNGDMTVDDADAYYTVYGEFSNNNHTIANGALSAEFGTLKMFYESNSSVEQVYVKTNKKEVLTANYKYNCATSLFAIQVSDNSALSVSSYATFGELRNSDAEDTLNDLLDAIDDYIDEKYNDSSKFTTTAEDVTTNNIEEVDEDLRGVLEDYTLTAEPIIIRSVKITKY